MPVPRNPKQSHSWRTFACFAVLGLVALWTLSRAPRFEARPGVSHAKPNAETYSVLSKNGKGDITQQSVTSTSRLRLLLSTHNRLFWYYPDTQEDVAVHEGQVPSSYLVYVLF